METDTDGYVYDASPFTLSVASAPPMQVPSTEEPNMEVPSTEETGTLPLEEVPFDQHDLYFNMRGKKYLHVFNHYKYESNQYYGPNAHNELTREGTHEDAKCLKLTFDGFGFKTVVHEDLRCEDVLQVVSELSSMDHRGTSCVAVAIMTHGRNGGVLLARDKPYYFSMVTDLLQNGHPSLVGKPKLFFVQDLQQYRGIREMHPVICVYGDLQQYRGIREMHPVICVYGACRSGHVDRGRPVLGKDNVVMPTPADTLVLYSSSPHYYSYRHTTDGAWMMQSLCKVLNQHHQFYDLGQMLTFVKNDVAEKGTKSNKLSTKQMPETTDTLTKLLKL